MLGAGGVVLRYGRLYGPWTYFAAASPPSFRIQVAATAWGTLEALEAPVPGVDAGPSFGRIVSLVESTARGPGGAGGPLSAGEVLPREKGAVTREGRRPWT